MQLIVLQWKMVNCIPSNAVYPVIVMKIIGTA
jgi:hypothetical protein